MKTQINLYQDLAPNGLSPSATKQIQSYTLWGLAGLLLLLTTIVWFQLYFQKSHLYSVQTEYQASQLRLADTLKKFPRLEEDKALERRIAQMEAEHALKAEALNAVLATHGSKAETFSSYMEALAKQAPYGLWLNRILIKKGGRRVEFDGETKRSPLVLAFLKQLGKTRVFAGQTFGYFDLKQEAKTKRTRFVVRTE